MGEALSPYLELLYLQVVGDLLIFDGFAPLATKHFDYQVLFYPEEEESVEILTQF